MEKIAPKNKVKLYKTDARNKNQKIIRHERGGHSFICLDFQA